MGRNINGRFTVSTKIPGKALSRQRARSKFGPASNFKCTDCNWQAEEYDHYLGYGENWDKVQPVCNSCHKQREWKRGSYEKARSKEHSTITCKHGIRPKRNCKTCWIQYKRDRRGYLQIS